MKKKKVGLTTKIFIALGIGLIMGVDRILDMFRTTVNVIRDCVCTLIVSKKSAFH